ncbi:RNA polymerase sigma factor [Algisphaera agarilytica]|uniref:RNA polymerase sigma-70 factor (ECF subfamily) n=1 Tax=Algisphaera agarilytica TaxID=1385975 RepID=A0A7X0LL49_9BACT|nr:sigma-70 family RNA polymerase sigma factor [Algisphaera agarilytica]MBB6429618.1 RNA polymerase sigma-70 factor (ECF subfamily) [Algisphaera agarilytica]
MASPDRVADEWLVLAAQDGRAEARDRLVDRWHARLWRHARNVTGNAEAARDVTQEAWVGILKRLHRLDDPAAFPAWAYRIVNHKSVDWIRKESRNRKRSAPLPDDLAAANESAAAEETRDRVQQVLAALQQLPVEQRALLSMHYLDDLSTIEIAAALNIPRGTVKSRMHTARQNLKPFLEGVQS